MHCGTTFTGSENFLLGVCPQNVKFLERIFYFRTFYTADAANDVANEIYYRWVWCIIYPFYPYTISKKLQSLVAAFSKLDRWFKKKRGESFLKPEAKFVLGINKLFDVFAKTLHSVDI